MFHSSLSRARERAETIVDRLVDGAGDAIERILVPTLMERFSGVLGQLGSASRSEDGRAGGGRWRRDLDPGPAAAAAASPGAPASAVGRP
jgi:hypothetical protein